MNLIENSDLLARHFGRWPSFHDAEIHRVSLERGHTGDAKLETDIHLSRYTGEVAADGFYVRDKELLVSLEFVGIEKLRLDDFNHQNVLWELGLTALEPGESAHLKLRVGMPTSFGCEMSFDCRSARVVDVQPFTGENSC